MSSVIEFQVQVTDGVILIPEQYKECTESIRKCTCDFDSARCSSDRARLINVRD
jgi:hypothetical protein